MSRFESPRMSIGGRSVGADETFAVVDPADGTVLAQAPDIGKAQLDDAIAAARSAFPGWSATPIDDRAVLLERFAEALAAQSDSLARMLTQEQGKPIGDARMEIGAAIYWLTQTCRFRLPEDVHVDNDQRRIVTRHVPLGVVAALVPWNFPVGLAAWKIAPALLAGNTLVLKPSPNTPLATLAMGEIARTIFPPGVFNVISGSDRLGPWLTAHPGVDKISFTGSTPTGRAILRAAADDLKRVTLELGGNDPAIVLEDAAVEELAPRLFWAAFANNAQFCLASKRMYVHEAVYDRLATALVAYAATVKVGNGLDQGTQLGPIQNRVQYDRVCAMLAEARDDGIAFLAGGTVEPGPGLFVPVSIADNPADDTRIVREEAFGPILPLLKFRSDEEVIERANRTIYGLGASIWTRDIDRAEAIAARIEAGTVWINTIHELDPAYAFAGHKQSGFGVENSLAGLLEYTAPKTMITAR